MLGTMLRRIGAATLPHQRAMRTSAANLFAEGSEASVGSKAYLPKFMDVAPSGLDPPTFQGDYGNAPAATAEDGTPLPIPEKVTFSLQLPHQAVYSREEVDMVLAPASTGDFGVLPGHVPTVAQLKPGVLQVHKTRDTDVTNYFINGGFAFVHANGQADVVAQGTSQYLFFFCLFAFFSCDCFKKLTLYEHHTHTHTNKRAYLSELKL